MADENFNPVLDWHDNFVLKVTYGFLPGVVFAQSFPGVGALSFTAPFIGLVNATAYVVNDNNNGDDHVLVNSPFSCNFQ